MSVIDAGTLRLILEANAKNLEGTLKKADKTVADFSKQSGKHATDAEKSATKAGGAWERMGKMAVAGMMAASIAAIAATKDIIKLGVKFEEATSIIRRATGATGQALNDLNASFKKLYGTVAQESAVVAKAVADVSTRLGLAGEQLEGVTKTMLDLARVTGESVEGITQSVSKVFRAFDVPAQEQIAFMDKLLVASQHSGLAVTDLANHLTNAGLAFVELGYGLDKSIALFSEFERVGVNPQAILSALNIVVTRLAKEGFTDANEAFSELIRRIREAPDYLTATTIATDAFGARVAGKLADDIRAGRFEVDDLVKALARSNETVAKAAAESETLGQKWARTKHQLELALEPLATTLVTRLGEAVDTLLETAEREGWGYAVGEMIGNAIADGMEYAAKNAPNIIWRLMKAAAKGSAEGWFKVGQELRWGALEADLEKAMQKHVGKGLEQGFYAAVDDLRGRSGAIQDAAGNVTSLFGDSLITDLDVIALKIRQGITLTAEEAERAIEAGFDPGRMAAIMAKQVKQANERLKLMIKGVPESFVEPGDFKGMTSFMAQFTEAAAARASVAKAAEESRQATKDEAEAAEQLKNVMSHLSAEYKNLGTAADAWKAAVESSAKAAGVAVDKYDEAKTSIAKWRAELEKGNQDIADYERNVYDLMERFGGLYDAEELAKALTSLSPAQLNKLKDATDEDAKEIINALMTNLYRKSDEHEKAFIDRAIEYGKAAGEPGGQGYANAWYQAYKDTMAETDLATPISGDFASAGWRAGTLYAKAIQSAIAYYGAATGKTSHAMGGRVGSYDRGGWIGQDKGLPPPRRSTGRAVPIIAHEGEYVLTENQADWLMSSYADGGEVLASYISRERARYSMYQAQDAPLELLERTLMDLIRFIDLAVVEAQAALDKAKAAGEAPEEINKLAQDLFKLSEDAARARTNLADLAGDGLAELKTAADEASGRLGMLEQLFGVLSQSSSGASRALGLIPDMLAATQVELTSYTALMNEASTATERLGYGSRAISSIEHMLRLERQALDTALQDQLSALDRWRSQAESALSLQAEALSRMTSTMSTALTQQRKDIQAEQRAQLDALAAYYDEQLAVLDARDRELERRKLVSQISSLHGAQFKTAADLDRIQQLREQQRTQERTDARRTLQEQREEALKTLRLQQETELARLESQQEAQQQALQMQQEAMAAARRRIDSEYEQQREILEASAQDQLDLAVEKYAKEIEIIMAMATDVTAAVYTMSDAVIDSALAKVDTTLTVPERTATGGGYSGGGTGYTAPGSTYDYIWDPHQYNPGGSSTFGAYVKRNYLAEYSTQMPYGFDVYTPPGAKLDPFAPDLGGAVLIPWTAEDDRTRGEAYRQGLLNAEYRKASDAFQARLRAGLYDSGGWLPPGISLAANFTGQPERILPPSSDITLGGGFTVRLETSGHVTITEEVADQLAGKFRQVVTEVVGRQMQSARSLSL